MPLDVRAAWFSDRDPCISRLPAARAVSAIDVGKVISPLVARNQVEGGIAMSIGMALFEAAEYDARNGLAVNNNYADTGCRCTLIQGDGWTNAIQVS